MRSTQDYVDKIPPLYAGKPNFVATIETTVSPFADMQTFLAALPQAFDLDTAVGVQLDAVGQWVGRSRIIPIPVTHPWFSWGIANRGWGQAYWKGVDVLGDTLAKLDDDTYRRLLRAKILANNADGTIADAQAALAEFFLSPTLIFTMDRTQAIAWIPGTPAPSEQRSGMQWQVGVAQQIPDLVSLEILAQDLIPVQPAGVYLDIKVITVPGTPLFGWGVSNEYIGGWGQGSWGASPDFVAQNIL